MRNKINEIMSICDSLADDIRTYVKEKRNHFVNLSKHYEWIRIDINEEYSENRHLCALQYDDKTDCLYFYVDNDIDECLEYDMYDVYDNCEKYSLSKFNTEYNYLQTVIDISDALSYYIKEENKNNTGK